MALLTEIAYLMKDLITSNDYIQAIILIHLFKPLFFQRIKVRNLCIFAVVLQQDELTLSAWF